MSLNLDNSKLEDLEEIAMNYINIPFEIMKKIHDAVMDNIWNDEYLGWDDCQINFEDENQIFQIYKDDLKSRLINLGSRLYLAKSDIFTIYHLSDENKLYYLEKYCKVNGLEVEN